MAVFYCNFNNGADINSDDEYPIILALKNHNREMANFLIQKGADLTVNDKVECTCIRNIENLKYPPEQLPCGYYAQNIHEYFEYLNFEFL